MVTGDGKYPSWFFDRVRVLHRFPWDQDSSCPRASRARWTSGHCVEESRRGALTRPTRAPACEYVSCVPDHSDMNPCRVRVIPIRTARALHASGSTWARDSLRATCLARRVYCVSRPVYTRMLYRRTRSERAQDGSRLARASAEEV